MTNTTINAFTTSEEKSSSWSSVFALAVCAFALVASEFLPVSLLTPMARDLGVSEGMTGQGIAISGAFAVLTSLFISSLAGNLNRKALLLGLTLLMGISGAFVALAPNYTIYMLGRALIGVTVGGFWSMSAATAIRLVSTRNVPRALAIINGGNALATVVAAPMGAYLGTIIGWRGAFLCLVPISFMALIWQWKALPSMPVITRTPGIGQLFKVFTLLTYPGACVGLLACGLFFMGQFSLFTYIRPFLEMVTNIQGATISLILLVIGAAGFLGTLLIGYILKWGFYQTLMVIALLMAAIAFCLVIFGHWLIGVVILLSLWGLTGTAAPVAWWVWVARVFPKDTEAGGGLMVAVVQLSIALGSTIGGLLFDTSGWQSTFIVSAGLLITCAALTALTARRAPISSHS